MNPYDATTRLLKALFDLARDDEIVDIFALSERCGASIYLTLKTLNELDERGLVDARRLRLTVLGLTAATALSGRDQKRLHKGVPMRLARTQRAA